MQALAARCSACGLGVAGIVDLARAPVRARARPGLIAVDATDYRAASRYRPRSMAGVSLIEMLLVIALIALASVLAASAFSGGIAGMQLRASAKEIAAQLRYTRTQAVVTGLPQKFVIDPQAHTWQAANGRHGEIPPKLSVSFTGARQVQPSRGEGAIVFFGDGASTGGRVQLSMKRAAWNIDVAWLTGQVKLRQVEANRR